MTAAAVLERGVERLRRGDLVRPLGRVSKVVGLAIEVTGLTASIGEVCQVRAPGHTLAAEVVGFRDGRLLLMPLGDLMGIQPGGEVLALGRPQAVAVDRSLLGRVVDGLGRPIDGGAPVDAAELRPIYAHTPPSALARRRISEPLETGIRAVDAILPIGLGQRVGIFAGSGVGKSVLLGNLASHAAADVNVIALIGERGREVREFIERDLGAGGLARSVVVVATADEAPLVRRQAAFVAATVAEFFRDAGQTVLLMMDSLTRLAMVQREIGLAVGEPPATRGYPPSVFTLLPRLLERAGTSEHRGSITGIYTVLVEGDDLNDPVADASRAILDGHVVLSRELAAANHFPAIDILGSVSRLTGDLLSGQEYRAASELRDHLATYRAARDLVAIGAYVRGSDAKIDRALASLDAVDAFLRQGRQERSRRRETLDCLQALFPEPEPGPPGAAPGTAGG
jgi:FliI/YscN family ATPase